MLLPFELRLRHPLCRHRPVGVGVLTLSCREAWRRKGAFWKEFWTVLYLPPLLDSFANITHQTRPTLGDLCKYVQNKKLPDAPSAIPARVAVGTAWSSWRRCSACFSWSARCVKECYPRERECYPSFLWLMWGVVFAVCCVAYSFFHINNHTCK